MPSNARPWLIAAGFVALYVAGGMLGNRLVVGSDSVVLLWPPGALAVVFLLHRGRRWWPMVAVADFAFSLFGTSVPPVFVPFTVAANTVGALAAVTVARWLGFGPRQTIDLQAVGHLGLAGLAYAVASAVFGVPGLVAAGFSSVQAAPGALAQWVAANVFGVLALAPAMTLLWPAPRPRRVRRPLPTGPGEALAWTLCLGIALLVVGGVDAEGTRNAQAILALPTIVLIWGALRLRQDLMAAGVLACGVALPLVAVAPGGALSAPVETIEVLLLLALLMTLALAPLILMAAIDEGRRLAARTLERARTDELTGLANRPGLEHRIGGALERGTEGEAMVLAFVDLDRFKLVNDAGGQNAGDAYLCAVAGLLRSCLARDALMGRLAADQFVVLLRRADAAQAEARLEALLAAIRDYRHRVGDGVLAGSASIGAIAFRRGQAGYAELLRLADAACATAKDLGGNRLKLAPFDRAEDAVAQRTEALRWAARLERALRDDHFRLHAQSIVPLGRDHGGGRHVEVLVRMVDPDTGELLAPGQFVAAAEKFQLGPLLDRHVVDRTLAFFERDPHALAQVELCAINLCAASVNDPGFAAFLRERFARSDVPPGRICLEITETSAVRDLDDAQQFIAAARGLGLKLALDDFGAGFCSFAYLRRLDVDYFKIDGAFVRDLESSVLSLAIVRAIAEIARSIDKRTIAEFVENDAVRLRLAQLGVDYGQGYGIDRPQPIEQYFRRPPAAILPL